MEHASETRQLLREKPDLKVLKPEDDWNIVDDDDSNRVENFLHEKGEKLHQIFSKEDVDLQTQALLPIQHTFDQSTMLHTEQFIQVMELYQASMKDTKFKALDLRGKHLWNEVLRVAEDAKAAYVKAGGKWYRRAGRAATTYAEASLPYLRLIPNDTCLSVLSGGLRLVFEITAAQLSERRDKVLKTLLRIPHIITQAEQCRANFPADEALYQRAEDVYIAALAAIEGTTKWLLQSSAWKPIKALMLGPLYTQSYKEKVQNLDEKLEALKERVTTLRDASIVNAEKIAMTVQSVVTSTGQKVSAMTEDISRLSKSQHEANIRAGHEEDLRQAKEEANRAMKIVLEESNKTAKWMQKNDRVIRRLKFQIHMLEKSATALGKDDLIEILAVPSDVPIQDLLRISRASQSTDLSAFDIAQVIVTGETFKEWKSTDESASLFIEMEGSSLSNSFRRNGPLSVLSSRVIESFENMEPAIPIYFFCGAHSSSNDPLKGPLGMMRSLISQVLRLFSVDLDFAGGRRYKEQLESLHLETLCDTFVKIVKRLPLDTVLFCVIDSVCFFERKEWAETCQKTISDLQDLASDDEVAAVFKLLVTSPQRSKYIGNSFSSRISLSVDESGAGSRTAPTERHRVRGARRMQSKKIAPLPSEASIIDRSEEELAEMGNEEESDV